MLGRGLLHESDEALVALIAAGDEWALGELYDRLGGVAYALALRVVRDPGRAEEAVQDAFLSVWRSSERFDGSRGLARNWLSTIVHRRAVDLVRQAVRLPGISEEGISEESSPSTDEKAVLRDEQRAVRHALGRVSRVQREALELAYYGGYSQTQIAERLGVPLGTIKTRIFNGLRRLGVLLSDPGVGALSPQPGHRRLAPEAVHIEFEQAAS